MNGIHAAFVMRFGGEPEAQLPGLPQLGGCALTPKPPAIFSPVLDPPRGREARYWVCSERR